MLVNTVEMKITADGLTGRAVVRQELIEGGSKSLRLEMTLRNRDGVTRVIIQKSVYDRQARPVSMSQKTSMPGGKALQDLEVKFTETRAEVTLTEGGKTQKSSVPAPAHQWRATPEFWFIRDKVEPGGETTYWRFDLASRKWVETKCVYVGLRKIKVAGKTYDAHCVLMGDVKSYLDDHGDPIRIENGRSIMERG